MTQRVEIMQLDERRIKLFIQGFPVRFVNAIRRAAMSDVPTLAVDFAYFYDNNTGIHDEIIAHRLGLTVLDSNEAISKYRPPEECRGAPESDPTCYVPIELDEAQGEEEQAGRYVTAESLRIGDPSVRPAYPGTILLYLAPGQRVHILAYARLGRGREHAKWSPVTVAASRYTPVIKYKKSAITEECRKCLEPYYSDILKAIDESGAEEGVVEAPWLERTSGLNYCASTACKGAVEVSYSPEKLVLDIESTGALTPERIVYEALRALEARAGRLLELVRGTGAEQ